MQLRYLPAGEGDIPEIFAQCKALVEAYEDLDQIDCDKVFGWLRRKIETNISSYTCVWLNGRKAAYYHLCPGDEAWELDDLYVLEPFRGKGIGSKIIQKCCEESPKNLFLYVFTENKRAVSFYRRNGFSVTQAVGATRCIMTYRP